MDATLQADLDAVAQKDAAIVPQGFSVVIEVPPTTPTTETVKFAPGVPPAPVV